jgi:hypothetical protein
MDRVAEHAPKRGDVAGQPIHADQQVQLAGTRAHLLHQRRDQRPVPLRTNHSAQPEPRGDRQGQRHPDPPPHQFDPQFVRLHVLQVDLPLLHEMFVDLLAVRPRPRQPGRHRAFIQAERRDDGLRRAAVAQQGQHERHLVGRRTQPVERRAPRGRERPAAGLAHVPLLPLAMHPDVALPDLPSGGAVPVVTELALRVHEVGPLHRVDWTRRPGACLIGPVCSTPNHG